MGEPKEGEVLNGKNESVDLKDFFPLAEKFFENQMVNNQAQNEIQKETIKFKQENLKAHKSAFTHKYWLIVLITVSILGISIGLIFIKDDTNTGISILSHVGAVVVGIIAGSGWERLRAK